MTASRLRWPALLLVIALLGACADNSTAPEPSGNGGNTNQAPAQPAIDTGGGAPADNATGIARTPVLRWTCTDPDADTLSFDVRFGTGATPPVVSSDQAELSYTPGTLAYSTTYYWQIVATDPGGKSTSSSVWQFTTLDQAVESVSAPNTPSGLISGETQQTLSYTTGGATSSFGHAVEYSFDWGDGNQSAWAAATGGDHSWSVAGTYTVKVRARCTLHNAVVSQWSDSIDVTIAEPQETITTPQAPVGPAVASVGEVITMVYSMTSVSNVGHALEYRFDWGDGNTSSWTMLNNDSHSYAAEGTYNVTAQARCAVHTGVTSELSPTHTIEISTAAETVSAPTVNVPATAPALASQVLSATGASSSYGHTLQYQFDYGDGTISGWTYNIASGYSWQQSGTFGVRARARCSQHTTVESEWSEIATIVITEAVSKPSSVSGPTSGSVGETLTYTVTGGASTDGHPVEYQLAIRDVNAGVFVDYSSWASSADIPYVFTSAGSYRIEAKARCATHPSIESAWSGYFSGPAVTITP